jgi:gentisate 1,2-dioxygenase
MWLEIERNGKRAFEVGLRLVDCPYTDNMAKLQGEGGQMYSPIIVWAWGFTDAAQEDDLARKAEGDDNDRLVRV